MDSDIDKVIAKIQKLFARAGRDGDKRGATEAEADTAMRIAQELMLAHNLDIATIEAAGRGAADGSQVRVKEGLDGKTRFKWQRDLAKYVAEAHFCYHLIKTDRRWDGEMRGGRGGWRASKEHVFVGRKSNVITARMMYQYLTGAIEDGAPEEDSRLEAGRTYHSGYKGKWYTLRSREDGRFEREGVVYDTLSAAARAITGVSTNGFLFWGLGAASTAVSYKEGMADRICERLAQRRRDLVEAHDARVREEEAARAAERQADVEASRARSERALRAGPPGAADWDKIRGSARVAGSAPTGVKAVRPEDDGSDWVPGENATAQSEAAVGVAMVLASVYDESEREANEEMALGLKPGTFARRRRESEEEAEARVAARAKQIDEDPIEGWKPGEAAKPETPKQQAARLRREAVDYAKRRARWAREDAASARRAEKEYARKDHGAYEAGAEAGDRVGLDAQVQAKTDTKTLEGK